MGCLTSVVVGLLGPAMLSKHVLLRVEEVPGILDIW